MNDILLYFAVKYEGDFEKIYTAIMNKEKCNYDEVKEIIKNITCKYTTVISNDYPIRLKNLNRPPFVIFYEGNLDLLNKKCIAVIGSRKNSEYGKKICEKIVKELVENEYVIISGLANGIDEIAHKVTLDNNGNTVAILGNGLDIYYPRSNEELQKAIRSKGLLISEYPLSTRPLKEYFPNRNRIIAALSEGVLVVESKKRSGTMITVNEALNLGKDIMCVPTRATENSGCNFLIKSGAHLVENGFDVMEILK